jgi:hypothetical protein
MMSIHVQLKRAVAASALCLFALAPLGDAQAANSYIPSDWNVAPMTSGAYREAFDSTLPTWATNGLSMATNAFVSITGMPARSNAWFGSNVKVLQLDTDGKVITNTLAYSGEGAVSFGTTPVYVDVRIKFDAMTDVPDPSLLEGVKLAVYVTSEAKLVAVHAAGATTNDTVLDTNKWYQLTIKMRTDGKYDVLTNDVVVSAFSGLALKSGGNNNQLAAVSFYGTGLVDELYVSHGDPAYTVTGPTTAIPTLPATGTNAPSASEQTRINAWLSGNAGVTPSTSLAALSKDDLNSAFLLNALGGDSANAAPVAYTFGITAIDVVSPTRLVVTVMLVANGSNKSGPINGKIQLQGKVNNSDPSWTTLSGAITPTYADFTAGKATYTYTIPAGGYRFFKPQIVP